MDDLSMERLVKPLWGEVDVDKVAITDTIKVPTPGYGLIHPLLVEKVMVDIRFLRCSCSAEVTAFEVNGLDVTRRAITKCVKCK